MTEREQPSGREKRLAHGPLPAGAQGGRPVVAIVGRPNVGKSTLFNRLAGKRLAIVEDIPGVTRDRHYADAWALGREYVLVDTGGFDPESEDPMMSGIARQVQLAIDEADLVVCVLDATTDPTTADREAVQLLRRASKPVIWVANKADSRGRLAGAMSHYELGLDHILPVSALHSHGVGDLEEAISKALPPAEGPTSEVASEVPRVAIVGRPNAGKSSLVNRLVGEERQLVDSRPGTTVDSIDTLLERAGRPLVLIDTAGIRRKRAKKESVEALSVLQAIRAMERSDVVVMMVDAAEGIAEQDAKIAGLAVDRGRGLVVVLNKVDRLTAEEQKKAVTRTREILAFATWAPIVKMSALTGRGVPKLIETIDGVVEEHRKRVPTAEVNRFFEEVLERHPPPTFHKRSVRLYYVTQAQTAPPTFVVMTNEPKGVHFSYQRYVQNQLRERFGFEGTPVRVWYRGKRRRGGDRDD